MFKVIKCGKQFRLDSVDAPYFPLLVNVKLDPEEATLYEVNCYLRSFAISPEGVLKAKRIAAALCQFFNFHYYKRTRRATEEVVAYTIIDESIMKKYQQWLKRFSNLDKPRSRNEQLRYIYNFYWYLEYKIGFITDVIGVSDGVRGITYNLPVRKASPKQKTDFLVPILEREIKNPTHTQTTHADWQNAYMKASSSKDPLSARDALMIRIIMGTALRREELNTLTINLFDAAPQIDSKYVYVTLNRSKFDKAKGKRDGQFPVSLYRKIKQYIKTHRRKLKKQGVSDEKALFLSKRGSPLGLTSVNWVLNKYGLKPHDGRKISLTELFIKRIELGHTKEMAIMEVSEIAGHAATSKGEVLEHCYMIASRILEAREIKSKLEEDNDKDAKIRELELTIESLQRQIDESAV